jgi:1,4-dihydroxy-6-naphthoate synthase
VAECAHDFRAVEETRPLLRRRAVPDVRILEDLRQRPAALVLPDHVLSDAVLARCAREEKRERVPEEVPNGHGGDSRYGARTVLIRLGHSPDPDDAFMFWALAHGRIDVRGFEFEHVLKDIQTLNEWALQGRLEVTALSLHAYPFVQDRYVLLPHGASMGFGYGPIVVSREEVDLREVEIAVPGRMTTAFLALRLHLGGDFEYREVPFDQILEEVSSGRADAGLLIHEGQLTYEAMGLRKVVDLGEWWTAETLLPLPLGVNVARRDLGQNVLADLSAVLGESIDAGLEHREEAMDYALRFGRGLRPELADRFVGMYVNDLTRDYGKDGREAVRELLRRGEAAGAFTAPVQVEFVGS